MGDKKNDVKLEVDEAKPAEGALADDALGEVTGGALPTWWLDGAAEALKKSDPDKVC